MGAANRVLGDITRGTTNANRLRRCDRWLAAWPGIRTLDRLTVVDLGFGARITTTWELARRLARQRPDVEVWGIEIDPERVARAKRDLSTYDGNVPLIHVAHGGFEIPLPDNERPGVIRAFNVLRQYEESEISSAWNAMLQRLHPDGLLIDGTCDEIGRVSSWIALSKAGPQTLTLSLRLGGLEFPSIAAERLPKALIHHNVPDEPVYEFLKALDSSWKANASLATFGAVQRWQATVTGMANSGWPIRDGKSRWRLGEITVDWTAVRPKNSP